MTEDATPPPVGRPMIWDRRDTAVLGGLLLVLVLYRLLTMEMIETGGDALFKWWWSRHLSADLILSHHWNHHSARLGINFWSVLASAAFGENPVVYYLPALLMSAFQVVFVFLFCRRQGGLFPAVLACLLLIVHPQMVRSGVQLLPGVFSGAYVMATIFFLSRCFEPRTGSFEANRTIAALCFFAAYLAKVPNLIFLPVFAGAIWAARGEFGDVVKFLGLLLALFLLEWAFYAVIVGGYPLGRLSVLHDFIAGRPDRTLAAQARGQATDLLALIAQRYGVDGLGGVPQAVFFYAGTAAAVVLAVSSRRLATGRCLIAAALIGFILIVGFAVTGFDPLSPLVGLQVRYYAVLVPLMSAAIGLLAGDVRDAVRRAAAGSRFARASGGAAATVVVLAVLALAGAGVAASRDNFVLSIDDHPFVVLQRYKAIVDRAVSDCLPFVAADGKSEKSLRRLFLDDYRRIDSPLTGRDDISSIGQTKACHRKLPDLAAHAAAQQVDGEIEVVRVSRFDAAGRPYFTIEWSQLPISPP